MANNLFVTNIAATSTSTRQLSGTARLTNTANALAAQIVNRFANSEDEADTQLVAQSMDDADKLNEMIEAFDADLTEDIEWLKGLDDDDLDKMLKSQQSKRSRCKSKEMTVDNYTSMMSAAVAEYMIREAAGKPKGASTAHGRGEAYTDEAIQKLAEDQEALKKAIRNIQSKKSIMKSKAGFDESSEEYQQLLDDEARLKAVRVGGGHVDATKQAIGQLLTGVDIKHLKADEAKDMLAQILGLTSDGEQAPAEGTEE